MEVSGQLHATAASSPEKKNRYPLDRIMDGTQIRSGRSGEEKNILPLQKFETMIFQDIA
jgi:hypothetical protein